MDASSCICHVCIYVCVCVCVCARAKNLWLHQEQNICYISPLMWLSNWSCLQFTNQMAWFVQTRTLRDWLFVGLLLQARRYRCGQVVIASGCNPYLCNESTRWTRWVFPAARAHRPGDPYRSSWRGGANLNIWSSQQWETFSKRCWL